MPIIEDLLVKLKETPPDTEEELRGMLKETGYDLVAVDPSAEEGPAEPGMEEEVAMEETPEGEEVGVEAEGGAQSLDEILGGMMGPKGGEEGTAESPSSPMDADKGGDVKGMSVSVLRGRTNRAAKNAIGKTKKA